MFLANLGLQGSRIMIIKKIGNHLRQQEWTSLFIELLVVVFGLFFAFQVDRWWEARGEREAEQAYISRLMEDINTDIINLTWAIELAEVRHGFSELLMQASDDPAVAETQPAMFLAALIQACYTFTPSLVSHTYEDLQATGNIALIRSETIKKALHEYYSFDQGQRQFMTLNFMTEFRFFELSAGILSHQQFSWVEDNWNIVTMKDLESIKAAHPEPEGLQQAIDNFRSRQAFQDWLPKVRGVQREQLWTHAGRVERAEKALEALQQHHGGGG